jgi:hypothetical protein
VQFVDGIGRWGPEGRSWDGRGNFLRQSRLTERRTKQCQQSHKAPSFLLFSSSSSPGPRSVSKPLEKLPGGSPSSPPPPSPLAHHRRASQRALLHPRDQHSQDGLGLRFGEACFLQGVAHLGRGRDAEREGRRNGGKKK